MQLSAEAAWAAMVAVAVAVVMAMEVAEEDAACADVAVEAVGVVAVGSAAARVVVGRAEQAVEVDVAEAVRWRTANRTGSVRGARH